MRWAGTILAAALALSGCETAPDPREFRTMSGNHGTVAADGTVTPTACRIQRVVDGDTLTLRCPDLRPVNVRLLGYDAPESYKPRCREEAIAGLRAKEALHGYVAQARNPVFHLHGVDRYGRPLMSVQFDGHDISDLMISEGYGVAYHGERRIDWCSRLA